MKFTLDDRQREIAKLLELLGPEPVAYFTDACRIMSDTTGLISQTHLAAHLLRELDARIRGVLRPMLAASAHSSLREAAEEGATHRAQIEAGGALVGLDQPTIQAWIDYAPELPRFTHRASLAAPRSVSEFRKHFDDGQAVLLAVLRKLQAIYADARPAVRELAAKESPAKQDLTTLKDHIPHSDVILREFFSLATLSWLPRLRKAKYFDSAPPPEVDDEGGVRYVGWPAARFLVRAADSEELREEVVEIFASLETDNPEARDATVEASLKMPPSLAARLAPKIAAYVRESNSWWIPRHAEELVAHLIDGGEVDAALTIAEPLLAAQPHTADWRMRHAFADVVPKLFPAAGLEGLAMLRSMLSADLDEEGRRERNDLSTIWRESIAGGHEMRRRDMLVTALNRAGAALIESGTASISDVVAALTVDDRLIFRRIALHLIAGHPEPEIASIWLRDEAVFFDYGLEREYAELAAGFFTQLEPDGKDEILGWIEAGPRWRPERLPAEEVDQYDDEWRLRRLRALPGLPDEWKTRYDELVTRIGDPGDPLATTRITTVFSGTRSPVEKTALLGMDDTELLEFIDEWAPADDDWRGPSREGLANALRDAAVDDPNRLSNLLPRLLERDPIYARHVLYGLDQVLTNGGAIDWTPALEFAREAVDRGAPGTQDDEEATWRWARIEVCRLILHGVGKREIPADMTDAVWQIILPLTEDPQPSVEDEEADAPGGGGFETYMWNTVRSLAIEAVIQIASWLREQAGDCEWTLPPHIRDVLDRHLDPAQEPTRTVLAIYGRHFNDLYRLDPEWATSHVHDIFPAEESRAAHRAAAWRAFVHGAWFWSGSWAVLAPEYERAVMALDAEQVEVDADALNDVSAALLGHLLGAYVQQCVGLDDDSLLARFFATAPLAVRTRFLDIVGMDVMNADSISDDARERLQRLWEWRAEAVIAGDNISELAPFAWWFGSGKFDDRWSLEQLIRVLNAGAGTTSDYTVTHRLAELVDTELELVVRAAAVLVERAYTPHLIFGASDEFRRILHAALTSGNDELVALARATISRLYSECHVEFSDLLDDDTRT